MQSRFAIKMNVTVAHQALKERKEMTDSLVSIVIGLELFLSCTSI